MKTHALLPDFEKFMDKHYKGWQDHLTENQIRNFFLIFDAGARAGMDKLLRDVNLTFTQFKYPQPELAEK